RQVADRVPEGGHDERLVHGGHVFGDALLDPPVADIVDMQDGEGGEVLPDPGDQLGPVETGHVVVAHDQVETDLGSPGGVQGGASVGHRNDLVAGVGEGTVDQGSNH